MSLGAHTNFVNARSPIDGQYLFSNSTELFSYCGVFSDKICDGLYVGLTSHVFRTGLRQASALNATSAKTISTVSMLCLIFFSVPGPVSRSATQGADCELIGVRRFEASRTTRLISARGFGHRTRRWQHVHCGDSVEDGCNHWCCEVVEGQEGVLAASHVFNPCHARCLAKRMAVPGTVEEVCFANVEDQSVLFTQYFLWRPLKSVTRFSEARTSAYKIAQCWPSSEPGGRALFLGGCRC